MGIGVSTQKSPLKNQFVVVATEEQALKYWRYHLEKPEADRGSIIIYVDGQEAPWQAPKASRPPKVPDALPEVSTGHPLAA